MIERVAEKGVIDRLAIGLSGLCLLHCVATVVLVAAFASVASVLTDPLIHETGLAIAVMLGAVALGQGYLTHRAVRPALVGGAGLALMATGLMLGHGFGEVVCTVAGVALLAAGHVLNTRARC